MTNINVTEEFAAATEAHQQALAKILIAYFTMKIETYVPDDKGHINRVVLGNYSYNGREESFFDIFHGEEPVNMGEKLPEAVRHFGDYCAARHPYFVPYCYKLVLDIPTKTIIIDFKHRGVSNIWED